MHLMRLLMAVVGFAGLILAAGYAVMAFVAILAWRTRRAFIDAPRLPPVTVLKPLCGAEPGLDDRSGAKAGG